jgi:hypothetical protein
MPKIPSRDIAHPNPPLVQGAYDGLGGQDRGVSKVEEPAVRIGIIAERFRKSGA